jgi:hypothetical protein
MPDIDENRFGFVISECACFIVIKKFYSSFLG